MWIHRHSFGIETWWQYTAVCTNHTTNGFQFYTSIGADTPKFDIVWYWFPTHERFQSQQQNQLAAWFAFIFMMAVFRNNPQIALKILSFANFPMNCHAAWHANVERYIICLLENQWVNWIEPNPDRIDVTQHVTNKCKLVLKQCCVEWFLLPQNNMMRNFHSPPKKKLTLPNQWRFPQDKLLGWRH